jgi:hypothetical protein
VRRVDPAERAEFLAKDIPHHRRPKPVKHEWLDQWLVAKREPLKGLITDLTAFLEQYEAENSSRSRRRKPADQDAFNDIVNVLGSNLVYAVLFPPPTGRLAINAGNATRSLTRYDNRALGKQYVRLVRMMANAGLVNLLYPLTQANRGEKSSIAPTYQFERRFMAGRGVTSADFGRHPNEQRVVLTRAVGKGERRKQHPVDYRDTPVTNAIRDEVRHVNAFLDAADIVFLDDSLLPRVDAFDRALTRHFNLREADIEERFDQGGRLFGGFWINLASGRRSHIRIQGEPIADLDFKNMFARLAYAEIGATPPEGDLYAIEGLEEYRSGVKMAFNVFLWDDSLRRKNWPKNKDTDKEEMGVGVGSDEDAKRDPRGAAAAVEARLPAGWENPRRLRDALLARHPALAGAFGRALGYRLMFNESTILLAVLDELMRRSIVALPLHDGLMVARSRASEAKGIMEGIGERLAGCRMPVVIKDVTHLLPG